MSSNEVNPVTNLGEFFDKDTNTTEDLQSAPDDRQTAYNNAIPPMFDIEDAPDNFDIDSMLAGMSPFKNKKFRVERKLPDNHYFEISKANIWDKILNISDMVLESKLVKTGGKLNFFDFEIADENMVDVRFGDHTNKILIKIPFLNSKGMVGESLQFYKPDLKAYVISCEEEGFLIHKDIERNKFMTYLFNKYCYVKQGINADSEERKVQRKSLFVDGNEYQQRCLVNEELLHQFLEPISKITEKRSKNEGEISTNRVHFYNDHAIIKCDSNSYVFLDYPKGMNFPEITVGSSFINILFALMSKPDPNQILEVSTIGTQRIMVKSPFFEVSGSQYDRLDLDEIEDFENIALSMQSDKFTWIDQYLLGRITKYSCNMRLCSKKLLFNYSGDGDVMCIALHEDDNKDFRYINILNPHKQNEAFPSLSKPVIVDSQSLRRLLNAFSDRDNVGALIREKEVIIKNKSKGISVLLTALE